MTPQHDMDVSQQVIIFMRVVIASFMDSVAKNMKPLFSPIGRKWQLILIVVIYFSQEMNLMTTLRKNVTVFFPH